MNIADLERRVLARANEDTELLHQLLKTAMCEKALPAQAAVGLRLLKQMASTGLALPLPPDVTAPWDEAVRLIARTHEDEKEVMEWLLGNAQNLVRRIGDNNGMQVYYSDELVKFAVFYPLDWLAKEKHGRPGHGLEIIFSESTREAYLKVILRPLASRTDSNAFVRSFERFWGRHVRLRRGKVAFTRLIQVANVVAFEGEALMRQRDLFGTLSRKIRIVAFVLGRYKCMIAGSSPMMSYPSFEPLLDRCVQSFCPFSMQTSGIARATALTNEAYVSIERGKWTEAKKKLLEPIGLCESAADTHSELAYIYDHEGNHDLAEKYLRRAVELNPNSPKFHSNLAVHLLRRERIEEAWQETQEALKSDPNYRSARELARLLSQFPKS